MNSLLTLNRKIMDDLRRYSYEFDKIKSNNYTSLCFNSVYNHAVLSLESLDNYYNLWGQKPPQYMTNHDIQQIRKENQERCMEITKSLFISTVSLIEFNIRNIIDSEEKHVLSDYINRSKKAYDEFELVYQCLDPQEKEKFKGVRKILKDLPPCDSISKIIQKSKSNGFITEVELKEWEFILTLRNITVHNNSISSKDLSIEINNRVFKMEKDVMMSDKLDVYLYLTNHIIKLFYNWSKYNYSITA